MWFFCSEYVKIIHYNLSETLGMDFRVSVSLRAPSEAGENVTDRQLRVQTPKSCFLSSLQLDIRLDNAHGFVSAI
jgi:hypothetical protein